MLQVYVFFDDDLKNPVRSIRSNNHELVRVIAKIYVNFWKENYSMVIVEDENTTETDEVLSDFSPGHYQNDYESFCILGESNFNYLRSIASTESKRIWKDIYKKSYQQNINLLAIKDIIK